MNTKPHHLERIRVRTEAIRWLDRLKATGVGDPDFVRWLAASPVHIEEALHVGCVWYQLRSLTNADWSEIEERSKTLKRGSDHLGPVLHLAVPRSRFSGSPSESEDSFGASRPGYVKFAQWIATASIIALILAIPMSQYHGRGGPGEIATTPGASINYVDDERSAGVALPPASKSAARVYSTALGMHKRLTLPDGSRAHLNSASSISVSISPSSRSIELIAGEALFEVNHESARPFRVKSGRSVIEDIGTAFDVYKKPHSTRVLVVDGRIKISRIATGSRSGPNDSRVHEGNIESNALSAEFHKGQQIELPDDSDGSAYTRSNLLDAELSRLTAWREGRIEYQGEPLEQAVEEFGRYHTERFILADEALRKLKIGGSISTSNVDQFLLMLRLEFDIRSDRSLEADGSTTITLTSGSPKRHRTIARDETEDP